jgi:hypothetical protein
MKIGIGAGKTVEGAGGLAGWLLDRIRRNVRPRPRLRLLERIALAPRQALALIEADGQRLLVATSPEGAPAFFPLDAPLRRDVNERVADACHARAGLLKRPTPVRVRVRRARAAW